MVSQLQTVFIFYSHFVANFLKEYLGNALIFFILSQGVCFVFFKSLAEGIGPSIPFDFLIEGHIFTFALMGAGPLLSYCCVDQTFLLDSLSKAQLYLLRAFQHFLIGIGLIGFFAIIPLAMGISDLSYLLILPIFIAPASLCAPLFLKNKHSIKKAHHHSPIFEYPIPGFSGDISAAIGLNLIYSFRSNRLGIFKWLAAVILTNVSISLYIAQSGSNQASPLFYIPFLISLLFATHHNTDMFADLGQYTEVSKKVGFYADMISWTLVLMLQCLLTALFLETSGLTDAKLFVGIFCTLPLVAAYAITLKFLYLESRMLRLLSLGISVGAPLVIPIFLYLFFYRRKHDSNF